MTFIYIMVIYVTLLWTRRGVTSQEVLKFSLQEEQDAGDVIGTVRESMTLRQTYNGSVLEFITFRFGANQPHSDLFDIDSRSGTIRTRIKVDRESFVHCRQAASCVLSLDVHTEPSLYFIIIKLQVSILDINDNAPYFAQPSVTLIVPESSPSGTVLPIEAAYDPDSPACGPANYSVTDQSGRFYIRVTELVQSTAEIYLVLRGDLDYEREAYYEFDVLVIDGCAPTHQSSIHVTVSVSDVNDNAPVFSRDSYDVVIPEDIVIGSSIVHVVATDPDTSSWGMVEYWLATDHREFIIDDSSGWVTTMRELDYERDTSYKLIVWAKDLHPLSPMSASAVIIIDVGDVNDNAPEMHVTALVAQMSDHNLVVAENQPIGTRIMYVTTSDADAGSKPNTTCTAHSDHVAMRRVSVDDYHGYLETTALVDREEHAYLRVNISCSDGGHPALYGHKNFTIEITDENDNAPRFEKESYFIGLVENTTVASLVLIVRARDPDQGQNGSISYTMGTGSDSHFKILEETGSILLEENIGPSESKNTTLYLNLTVIASDHGVPSLSTSVHVVVMVIRLHENPPRTAHALYTFQVMENQPRYTRVGQIQLLWPGRAPADALVYTIDTIHVPFLISREHGELRNTEPLDRERHQIYTFDVTVRYKRQIVSSHVTVNVVIGDLNDNRPSILYPDSVNYSVWIDKHLPPGSIVAKVIAKDPDSGNNSLLQYRLLSNPVDEISVTRDHGVIYVAADLSHVTDRNVTLVILVEDQGVPQLNSTAVLGITIEGNVSGDQLTTRTLLASDWIIAVCVGVAVVLVVIVGIVIRIVRRQRDADRRYKVMVRELENLKNLDPDPGRIGAPPTYPHEHIHLGDISLHPEWGHQRIWPRREIDAGSIYSVELSTSDSGRGSSMTAA